MPGYLDPQKLPPLVTQNQEGIQQVERHCRNHAHVDCGNRRSVISEKGLPRLRWRSAMAHHVFGNRGLGDLKAKHEEFAMDPRRTPQLVFIAYPLDEITQTAINL